MTLVSESSSCIFRNYNPTWFQNMCARLLQQGPMPQHLAIIMDGNRRYAKKMGLSKVWEGHQKGEETCLKVVNMCFDLNIPHLTVFSFSSDNFKRSAAEVKGIMDLTLNRMKAIFEGMEEMKERGICWDVLGNWNKVPSSEIRDLFSKTTYLTKDHKRLTIHLAFSYSAHQEISRGVSNLVSGLLNKQLELSDLNENLLQESWGLQADIPPVDILLRTSGDTRLSDFQLWQAGNAYLEFIDKAWPEFSFDDLLWTIFWYQRQVVFLGLPRNEHTEKSKKDSQCDKMTLINNNEAIEEIGLKRKTRFLRDLREGKWETIQKKI